MKKDSTPYKILINLIRGAGFTLFLLFLMVQADESSIPMLDQILVLNDRQWAGWQIVFLFLSALPLWFTFHEYNPPAQRATVRDRESVPKLWQSLLETIRSPIFYTDLLLFLLPPLIFGAGKPIGDFLFYPDSPPPIASAGLGILLWVVPLTPILWFGSAVIRRSWIRNYLAQGNLGKRAILGEMKAKGGYSLLRFTLNLAGTLGGLMIAPMLLEIVLSISGIVLLLFRTYIKHIAALILLLYLLRCLLYARHRRKFAAAMRSVCDQRGYSFEILPRRGKWRLTFSGREEYRVEAEGKRYSLCLLRVAHSYSRLFFHPEGGYSYHVRFMWFRFFLPRHRFKIDGIGDGSGERIVLLTREPAVLAYGSKELQRFYQLYNGKQMDGYSLYTTEAFCNYIDRLSIHK